MAYDFEKDKSAKSFQMKLDNETIMTTFITTEDEADGELPELDTGVYGGIGYGCMGPDFEFLGSGGGGESGDFSTATITVNFEFPEWEEDATIPMTLYCCGIVGISDPEIREKITNYISFHAGDTSITTKFKDVVLYKGRQHISDFKIILGTNDELPVSSVSGDLSISTIDVTQRILTITGDGVINIIYTDND